MTTSNGILSGLVLKAYIILAIKLVFEVFTIETLVKLRIADVLFVLGVLGMIMGSFYAVRESRLKRMLAYSSVAHLYGDWLRLRGGDACSLLPCSGTRRYKIYAFPLLWYLY